MDLSKNIYRYRTEQGLSQEALAEAMQVSRQSVSKWETGASVPELDKLLKMSALFGISLDTLVGNEPPKPDAHPSAPAAEPDPREPSAGAEPQLQPDFPFLPLQKLLGLVLLGLGLLALLLGWLADHHSREIVILAGFCAALCGGFCLGSGYPQLYSGWSLWCGWAVWVFVLTPRWEDQGFLIGLTLAAAIGLLIWTVWAHRAGKTRIPLWLGILGSLVLLMLGILLMINIIPPGAGYGIAPEEITGV